MQRADHTLSHLSNMTEGPGGFCRLNNTTFELLKNEWLATTRRPKNRRGRSTLFIRIRNGHPHPATVCIICLRHER